jgi:drug/metabolite transporter (DMT)-like permease
MWGVADFIGGTESRRLPVVVVGLITQAIGLVALVCVVAAVGLDRLPLTTVLLGLGAGVLGFAAIWSLYLSLAIGDIARIAPIFATATVIPVFFGLLNNERPTAGQGAGIALAVAGVVMVSLEPREDVRAGRARHRRALLLALLATASIGVLQIVLQKLATDGPFIGPLLIRATTVALFGAIVGARVGADALVSIPGRSAALLVGLGLADAAAVTLFAAATTHGLLVVVAPLAGTFPAVTVLLAMAILGERLRWWQGLGVAAAILGGALVSAA